MQDAWRREFLWRIARGKADRLRRVWDGLTTPARLRAHQSAVRLRSWELLGGPAARGDLAPRVTGTLRASGCLVERLHFQSLPGFRVTANVYVPARLRGRAPAVLIPVGHHREAKA